MIRHIVAIALAPALFASSAMAQTVVIVRHGEKVAPKGDPDLSAAGRARAQALAQALSGARIAMVLATPLKRTQQTAQPAAQAAGVTVVPAPFDGGDAAHAQRLAGQARTAPTDATVLIVGHSNTVADIAKALGDTAAQAPTDCEYDQITVIQLAGSAAPKVVHARYGVPTPAC
ncbi:histidine phosphatase family protein [Caulobacter sp. DWR1-3-2b1]|uniref:histidine phosphatase family protein n=1 Tax=Caulobacter sp. DWR1-3-2b1 TaxID=2804670 RepID=UPI003CFB9045